MSNENSPIYIESSRASSEKALRLINNSSYFGIQQGSPCLITITGECVNPSWSIVQNGQIVGTDGFLLSLVNDQKLVVSSYPETQYARIYNANGSYSDVSQLQDFTKSNFVRVPEGQSTMLAYVSLTATFNVTFKEERLLV